MSFFDQAYDDMSWQEVCYRLPSDLAVNAIKRRVNNLETLRMLFDNVGSQPASVKPLKEHINSVVSDEDPGDILDEFGDNYEKVLFNWLDDNNRQRIRLHDPDKLSTKFLFNVTKSDDKEGLGKLMERVLAEDPVNQSHLRAVLNKADDQYFTSMIGPVLKDSRPEVRVCVLGVTGLSNKSRLSDLQKTIGLKALAKCSDYQPVSSIGVLNIDIFANLKPLERLDALEKYLSYFPRYKKVSAFDPAPTQEEFDMILFAGCIEHNDKVTKLNQRYQEITAMDPPSRGDDEEDE